MEYRDWIGPRKFYFLLPILCPYLPSLVSTSDTIMPWNIFKLGNEFNYNDDPSPTPKKLRNGRIIAHQRCHTVRPQSADCHHPIGISVSCGDSLLFYGRMLTYNCYIFSHATYFALQFAFRA